jgi:DNA ligase-1
MTLTNPIFKRDSTGKVRSWQAEYEGPQWRTIAGLVDGKKVVSGWTVCTPKSKDTAELQAEFEAKAAEKHNLDREYAVSLEAFDAAKKSGTAMFECMLAQEYGKVTKKNPLVFPVIVQPKLDGIRCIINAKGAFSRQNQQFHSVPHILKALEGYFKEYPDAIIDGELYHHDLKADFQQITSIVRREKFKPGDLEKSAELIQYHVYDGAGPGDNAWKRTTQLRLWLGDMVGGGHLLDHYGPIHFVPTHIVNRQEALDEHHHRAIHAGYEGSMVRVPGEYENKRSNLLLKRKDFDTAEFDVLDIQSGNGNWAGAAKRFILKVPGARIQYMEPDTCESGTRGTFDYNAQVLAEKDKYIGKPATVRYFGKTDDGALRFPVVIDLHPTGRKD